MNSKNDDLLVTGSRLESLASDLLDAIEKNDMNQAARLESDIHELVATITARISAKSGQDCTGLKSLGEAVRSLDQAVEEFESEPTEEARERLDRSLIRLVYARGKRMD